MKTILFVCTGNICRSPMAEALFRQAVAGRGDYQCLSAGLGAMDGQPYSIHAVRALRERGIELTDAWSQALTPQLVADADYIFGMTQGHVDAIALLYPHATEKVFLLREFDETAGFRDKEISDPIGGSYETYVRCRDQIEQSLASIKKFMEQNTPAAADGSLEHPRSVALGADHRGFELKEVIKGYFQEQGFKVTDYGTHSTAACDYPDLAHLVAQAVAAQTSDLGILVCGTGAGMSMAANKLPEIRAALVVDEAMATVVRQHNNANVLCLGANQTAPDRALKIIEAFLAARFEGGRHQQRVDKFSENTPSAQLRLKRVDPEVAEVIALERLRQQENIELIASENFTSPAVMEAQGSVLTNKYAEGYPGKRWYGGCEHIDIIERLAIERARQLFGAEHANVQPHCGSTANMIVYFAFLKPGDKLLTMNLSHGGHLTHGHKVNFSGRFFEVVHYGVSQKDERIDYDELAELARQHRPRMITVGASAYARQIDFVRMGEIAREVEAYLLADIAHIAGLVAAGLHPSPVGQADFVTTTTHKTLRGPRGGLILCPAKYAKEIDAQTFPGVQGGPLEHVIAAKAVCFHEASQPAFKVYQEQTLKNARALADGMFKNGYRLISGGTDNHLLLVDVGGRGLTGKDAQIALDAAGITVNKNTIPFETRSPFLASGIRLGSPAVTTRGMREPEMAAIADMISEVLFEIKNVDAARQVRERVRELTARFPLPY